MRRIIFHQLRGGATPNCTVVSHATFGPGKIQPLAVSPMLGVRAGRQSIRKSRFVRSIRPEFRLKPCLVVTKVLMRQLGLPAGVHNKVAICVN